MLSHCNNDLYVHVSLNSNDTFLAASNILSDTLIEKLIIQIPGEFWYFGGF